MIKQFTASVYILRDSQLLLIFHPKLKKWLPPGGHVEPNESPVEAARREALEETGYEIEFIKQENVWINQWNANSFERPYLCLLEEISAHNEMPAHKHMDLIYVARAIRQVHTAELPIRWFGLEALTQLQADVDIFKETLEVTTHLLNQFEYTLT